MFVKMSEVCGRWKVRFPIEKANEMAQIAKIPCHYSLIERHCFLFSNFLQPKALFLQFVVLKKRHRNTKWLDEESKVVDLKSIWNVWTGCYYNNNYGERFAKNVLSYDLMVSSTIL